MNSKHEQQDNQPISAAVEKANNTRQEQCRIALHRPVPPVSSSEASRHTDPKQEAPALPIRLLLSIVPQFSSTPRPAVRHLSAIHPRLVSRLVLSRLEGRLVSISNCLIHTVFVISPRRGFLVGSYSSRLIARRSTRHRHRPILINSYIHRIPVSLYLSYTSHTSYSLYTSIDDPRSNSQATRLPSRLLKSNERHEARAIRPGEQETGDH